MKTSRWMDEIVGSYKGIEYVVKLMSVGHRCAYIRIPQKYLDADVYITEEGAFGNPFNPVPVHGGVTYSGHTDGYSEGGGYLPTTGYWFGWDYAHDGDDMDVEAVKREFGKEVEPWGDGHVWTSREVEWECKQAIDDLIKYADPLLLPNNFFVLILEDGKPLMLESRLYKKTRNHTWPKMCNIRRVLKDTGHTKSKFMFALFVEDNECFGFYPTVYDDGSVKLWLA